LDAQPNGARLSCAAVLWFSQLQFYYDGRRQLQPLVRLRSEDRCLGAQPRPAPEEHQPWLGQAPRPRSRMERGSDLTSFAAPRAPRDLAQPCDPRIAPDLARRICLVGIGTVSVVVV